LDDWRAIEGATNDDNSKTFTAAIVAQHKPSLNDALVAIGEPIP